MPAFNLVPRKAFLVWSGAPESPVLCNGWAPSNSGIGPAGETRFEQFEGHKLGFCAGTFMLIMMHQMTKAEMTNYLKKKKKVLCSFEWKSFQSSVKKLNDKFCVRNTFC